MTLGWNPGPGRFRADNRNDLFILTGQECRSGMTFSNAALAKAYDPVTFIERGASIPFTTPLLAGARGRIGSAGGIELLVPSPSGAPGLYVLSWSKAQEFCRPTVHDTKLREVLATRSRLTPSSVRAAARSIALDGLAGRAAQSAADEAISREREAEQNARFRLGLELLRQSGVATDPEPLPLRTEEKEALVAEGLPQIADRIGWPVNRLKASVAHIGRLVADIGLSAEAGAGRLPALLANLSQTRADIVEWASNRMDDAAIDAETTVALAGQSIVSSESVLVQLRRGLSDLPRLLRYWADDAVDLDELAERPGWITDGWERICFLWQSADTDPARCRALAEMCLFAPQLPKEVAAWTGIPAPLRAPRPARGLVRLNHDWRNGKIFELIARNEQFRAVAA